VSARDGLSALWPDDHPLRSVNDSWHNDTITALGLDADSTTTDPGSDSSTQSPVTPNEYTPLLPKCRSEFRSKSEPSTSLTVPEDTSRQRSSSTENPGIMALRMLGVPIPPCPDRQVARSIVEGAHNPYEQYRDPTRQYRTVPPRISSKDSHRKATLVDGLLSLDGALDVDLNRNYSLFDTEWTLHSELSFKDEPRNMPRDEAEDENEAGPSSRRTSRRESVKNKVVLVVRRASNWLQNLDLSTRSDPKGKGRRNM
jgi:hypothetical protein